MHEIGRFGGDKKEKTKAQRKASQTPRPPSADAGSTVTETALPAGAPKKRGRGRPPKVPIKELDEDAPSPTSDGAEYDLEVPKDVEVEEDEAVVDGETGGVEEADDVEEEEEEEEEGDEVEGGGDDDDEEEYTADGEQDEEVMQPRDERGVCVCACVRACGCVKRTEVGQRNTKYNGCPINMRCWRQLRWVHFLFWLDDWRNGSTLALARTKKIGTIECSSPVWSPRCCGSPHTKHTLRVCVIPTACKIKYQYWSHFPLVEL